ncbi:MAG: hypothetical protein JWO14_1807 [Solirubrobacterales bacterium]|nr:hypothetical protein [Solirubrobacterales bacterium]
MKNRPRSFSRLVPLLVALAALTGLIVAVASADATTATSPPIEPLTPSENAGVQASAEPLAVTFTCPAFAAEEGEVIEEPEEEAVEETLEERKERAERELQQIKEEEEGVVFPEEGVVPPVVLREPPVLGGGEEYGVHFSTSFTTDKFGQLGTTGFGEAGEGSSEPIKGSAAQCSSELELPTKPVPAALYEGRIYWQVFRESAFGENGVEVGPVHSFMVFPFIELPELIFREQIFAGYLTKVGFDYEAELGGAVVQLQEWENGAWKTIAEAPGSNGGENAFYVKPKKAGRHVFRPLVLGGAQPQGLESVSKVVRKPTKQRVTSAADDGSYLAASGKEREEWPIEFSVASNGTVLRNLNVEAETTCKGPTKAQDVKLEVPAHLRNAKIAPDGTVFGVTKSAAPEEWTVTLTGSIFQGRFQGELKTSHANCTGYRTIDAVLQKPKKK